MRSFIGSLVLATTLFTAGCGGAQTDALKATQDAVPAALTIAERTVPDFRMVSAVLTNRDVGDARARIGGRITQIFVKEGDTVRAGQLVAVISDDRISLEADAASASVRAAEASSQQAQQDLQRAERLFSGGAISRAAIDQARSAAKAAEAQMQSARAQAGAARALNSQGQVVAPSAGEVIRIPSPRGAVIMPGEVVVQITTGVPVLRIELPESEAANLKQGQSIRFLTDDSEEPSFATIRQVYPAVSSGRVVADIDASGIDRQLVGGRVRVMAPAGERVAIVIPDSYIDTRYGADYVRLSRKGGATIEAPVQRGARVPLDDMPDGVEIMSGLRAGDVILPVERAS
ncbi:MAG: efflux RND transporter periplasmic adaptor subunit [Hyphomonadaceae bacterium]|nr:efflux RND transporter periplasmic adaptor subunit [Hyphomonadaceae bacterium]